MVVGLFLDLYAPEQNAPVRPCMSVGPSRFIFGSLKKTTGLSLGTASAARYPARRVALRVNELDIHLEKGSFRFCVSFSRSPEHKDP